MSENILYENLDILSVMEACDDNSFDLVLVFMPTNMGGTVGEKSLRPFISPSQSKAYNELNRFRYLDYGKAEFFDEQQYDSYVGLIKKVIQNAGRVLCRKGVFCFGIPKHFDIVSRTEADKMQIKLLLQQTFENTTAIEVSNFSINAKPEIVDSDENKYILYICSNGCGFLDGYNEIYNLKLPSESAINQFLLKYKGMLDMKVPAEKGWLRSEYLTAIRLLNMLMIPELRDKDYIETALNLKCKKQYEAEAAHIRSEIEKILEDKSNYVSLAESLMLTYCKEEDRVLFPYDRNGQYAEIADRLHLSWVSLYKKSLSRNAAYAYAKLIEKNQDEKVALQRVELLFGDECTDFIAKINPEHYLKEKTVPEHKPIQYDTNFISSAKDANALKTKFSKITNDIIECAAASGLENSNNMEDAIHAVIGMAVRAQEGKINGDEAKNWYGDGWEELSKRCQDYLQTAFAFEKMSQQNETADFAPIVIEYCRAVELESNSVVIRPYMKSIHDKSYQKDTYDNSRAADYFKSVIERFSDKDKPNSMMLGEIGTSLSYASTSYHDGDIYYTLRKYCIADGRQHLLDSVTVGKYKLIGQIRNQSVHPSSLDKGCVSQVRQLVKDALKAQQRSKDNQAVVNEPLVCAIIGPDANKMSKTNNIALLRAAIRNQINILNKSRIQAFASSGNAGFDLIVAECLLKYKKEDKDNRYVNLTEYLPSLRKAMRFPDKIRQRILKVDDIAKTIICGDANNAENREICQRKALEKAQFCIAYFKPGGGSKIEDMVNEAIKEHGLIVWNAYGIE